MLTPAEHVEWQGVDWSHVFIFALAWEACYQMSKRFCQHYYVDHPKVVELGGSYFTAFANAWVCSVAGVIAFVSLLGEDEAVRSLVFPPGETPRLASIGVYMAAHSFLGWLLSDVIHLVTHWPALGGVDMLIHHACFTCLSMIGTGYRICPLVIGWLLMGEISSIFLNIRWLLINTGRGDSRLLKRVNLAFAFSFFTCRVVVFWGGVAHVFVSELPFLLAPPRSAPRWALHLLVGFVTAGALLNAFWLVKILKVALGPPPTKPRVATLETAELKSGMSVDSTLDSPWSSNFSSSDVGDGLPPV